MSSLLPLTDERRAVVRTGVSSQLLHDLRSPLNQIIGYTEMLTEEAERQEGHPFAVDLRKIHAAGQRMLELIEENFTAAAALRASPAAAVAERPVESGPRTLPAVTSGLLLVVDDDEANRDVLSRRLTQQGHEVVTASSGRDALALLQVQAFDVVLLDVMMPDMDGYEVLGRIKSDERLQRTPVVMISALNEVQSVIRCIEAGADDYLAKPFDSMLLRARIAASLEAKRGRDRELILFEQLNRSYARLQEVEKLRDDMRNMIVHDLRTPLTAIIVGVQMLANQGALSDSQRDLVDIAVTGGTTLLGMVNDLLDVEKMESGKTQLRYEELTAGGLITAAIDQLAPLAAEGGTTVVAEFAADLPTFAGDRNKLSRTLVNLMANAIHFARSGTVTVTAAVEDEGRGVRFAVRDTGRGIPAESFERIFDKFGQLDARSNVGTGLGLAFCKLAVEAHGGRIWVESTPGVGSVFSFALPIVAH